MLICKCCKISTSLLDSCTWEFWSFKKANLRRFFNYNNQLIYCLFIYLFSRQLFFKLKIKRNRVDLLYWINQHFGQKKNSCLIKRSAPCSRIFATIWVESSLERLRNLVSGTRSPLFQWTLSSARKGFIMEQCRLWNMDHVSREQP